MNLPDEESTDKWRIVIENREFVSNRTECVASRRNDKTLIIHSESDHQIEIGQSNDFAANFNSEQIVDAFSTPNGTTTTTSSQRPRSINHSASASLGNCLIKIL